MYEDDEDDFIEQYEDELYQSSSSKGSGSSDDMDSDLEDTIMSMVQYGDKDEPKKKNTQSETKDTPVQVVDAASSSSDKRDSKQTVDVQKEIWGLEDSDEESSDSAITINDSDDEMEDSDLEEFDELNEGQKHKDEPPVTRYIELSMDTKQPEEYLDDVVSDKEEEQLNRKLLAIIDDQINRRQRDLRFASPAMQTCYNCLQPGHQAYQCQLCPDCAGPKHRPQQCVGNSYCPRCKRRGHSEEACKYEREDKPCRRCGTKGHNTVHCPTLIHAYTDEKKVPESPRSASKPRPPIFCYFCGDGGHYGDDCGLLPKQLKELSTPFNVQNLSDKEQVAYKAKKRKSKTSKTPRETSESHFLFSDSDSEPYHHPKGKRGKQKKPKSDSHQQNTFRPAHVSDRYRSQSPSPGDQKYRDHRTGNDNWKALRGRIPRPTQSGTLYTNKEHSTDFPRNPSATLHTQALPQPTSSGIIDIPIAKSPRRPRYHGGYSLRR